eukprot:8369733-Heterocapsa_arctica.AAC.2
MATRRTQMSSSDKADEDGETTLMRAQSVACPLVAICDGCCLISGLAMMTTCSDEYTHKKSPTI